MTACVCVSLCGRSLANTLIRNSWISLVCHTLSCLCKLLLPTYRGGTRWEMLLPTYRGPVCTARQMRQAFTPRLICTSKLDEVEPLCLDLIDQSVSWAVDKAGGVGDGMQMQKSRIKFDKSLLKLSRGKDFFNHLSHSHWTVTTVWAIDVASLFSCVGPSIIANVFYSVFTQRKMRLICVWWQSQHEQQQRKQSKTKAKQIPMPQRCATHTRTYTQIDRALGHTVT